MIDSKLEKRWFEEKNKSVSKLTSFIKKCPNILKKYKFDKIQSEIISKLLKSNDCFWHEIEEVTKNSRKRRTVINNIEEKVFDLTGKITEEIAKDTPNQDIISFLREELEYIGDNFDPETSTLITYEEVNKDYADIDLIFFFVEYAEELDTFIENTMEKDGVFKKDELFLDYITNLFAYSLNGIGIEFVNDTISLKIVVDDEDIEAVKELNDNNN